MARLTFQQEFQILKRCLARRDVNLYFVACHCCDRATHPEDVEDCTVYTILSKPVPRVSSTCSARLRRRAVASLPISNAGHEPMCSRVLLQANKLLAPTLDDAAPGAEQVDDALARVAVRSLINSSPAVHQFI